MRFIFIVFISVFTFSLNGQDYFAGFEFDSADTLRGKLNPQRTCYDVTFYDLFINLNPSEKFIEGKNTIYFEATEDFTFLQVDLFEEMEVKEILYEGQAIPFVRKHQALIVEFPEIRKGTKGHFQITYQGHPIVAARAPWDGGFVFSKDSNGKDWIGVACEGTGASLWWPNKDHLSDEPDSMRFTMVVPKGLMAVGNGNLIKKAAYNDEKDLFEWFISYPINNYNVSLNVADYAHFSDTYTALDGEQLACDYYVLKENLSKATKHFEQVPGVLKAFEHYFGKYPFWKDGYALIETPYLGMEHQSGIAYGNKYMRGYMGGMIPRDMDWDYIIVHETGHEYWGNSVSSNDHAEMWIHESFTTYMEALYVEYHYGLERAIAYLNSQRKYIQNKLPVLGPLDVNFDKFGSSDHYYKGAWILHTLRNDINDDELWFRILKSLHEDHKITNVTTEDIVQFISKKSGKDYHAFFEQYLKHPKPPTLIYRIEEYKNKCRLAYKWDADVGNFNMSVIIGEGKKRTRIFPESEWQSISMKGMDKNNVNFRTDLFYIVTKKIE